VGLTRRVPHVLWRTQELPGKKVLHEVVVQGDHGVGVAEYLRRDCGLPASLVKQHSNCK